MKLKITVHGVSYEVDVEVLDAGEGFPTSSALPPVGPGAGGMPPGHAPSATLPRPSSRLPAAGGAPAGSVTCPIAGTVVELRCKVGDMVAANQVLVVIEAMKMNTNISAPTAGKVVAIPVAVGDSAREGQVIVELE